MYEFHNIIDYLNEALFNLVHIRHNQRIRAQILVNQIYFTGIQAFPLIIVISFFLGAFVVQMGMFIIGGGGQLEWVYEILITSVIRDLAPMFIAVILLLRSGTAISTEMGVMKVNNEIDALLVLGISPISYLVYS